MSGTLHICEVDLCARHKLQFGIIWLRRVQSPALLFVLVLVLVNRNFIRRMDEYEYDDEDGSSVLGPQLSVISTLTPETK